MVEVVGVGGNTEDHVWVVDNEPPAGGKQRVAQYFRQPGGQVPTALVALSRWGMATAYVGPIGDDAAGRAQIDSLRREGVDTSGCRTVLGVASEVSFISVDAASGERTILWYRDDRLRFAAADFDPSSLAGARAVLLDGAAGELAIAVAAAARAAGARVVLDVDTPDTTTRRLLAHSDIAIVPAGFLAAFAPGRDEGAALAELAAAGPAIAVVTSGAEGVTAWSAGRLLRQPAFAVRAVDTTSAGDVFHAAFLYATLEGREMSEIMQFAAAAAALTCTELGGRSAIPTLAAVGALAAGAPPGA